MNRNFSAWLVAVCIASTSIGPALAESEASTPHSKGFSIDWRDMPRRAAGFVVGSVVGTPVCLVKRLAINEAAGAHALVGQKTKSLFLLVPAGIGWLPYAAIGSTVEAPCYSVRNSWLAKEPFGQEQFSLEKDSCEPLP